MNWRKIPIYFLVTLVIFTLFFYLFYRPWNLRWGATDKEVERWMVGDNLVRETNFNATRAVTIEATPDQIWPWIVQVGYKRAGFYSYDILDNDNIPSADSIIPEFQDLKIGDRVPLSRTLSVEVLALKEQKYLLLDFGSAIVGTWAWGIYPVNDHTTRLVSRLCVRFESAWPRTLWEAFEIFMMRKHLLGVKQRAEKLSKEEKS